MTTCTLALRKHPANNSSGVFLFLTLLTILLATVIATSATLHKQVSITIMTHPHGTYAHGNEGEQARNCLSQHGSSLVYMEPDKITFHFLCQSDAGEWFDVVARKIQDDLFDEMSAYQPKEGIFSKILKWLASAKKGAIPFSGFPQGTTIIFQ